MKKIFTILFWVCCGVLASAQTAVFVSADGNDNNNGSSWSAAKQTIAAGIAAAGDNGTVYVKAGSYSVGSQLNIPAGVSVKGGRLTLSGTDTTGRELPGTNSRWENASVCTILTGGGSNRIAVVNGLLEGCVMRRGVTTEQGGGVLIDGGTVRYCVIRECDAIQESNRTAEGGGAYILNNGVLTNCVITECRGDNGPAVAGGPGSLVNNTITRNWPTHCGKVADYDGNVYNTVVIGQQCWTHENLRTTHYNDGTAIPLGNNQPTSSTSPYYYINYNGLTATNLVNYGYLYNWPAVMHGAPSSNENPSGVTGICPSGWHVPSDAEWTELTNFVNIITRYRCSGYDGQIGKALASTSGWTSNNTTCQVGSNQGGNNTTGFKAYPAGYYNNSYDGFSMRAYFWSSTERTSSGAWARRINCEEAGVQRNDGVKPDALSVRCVKQLANSAPIVHTNPVTASNIQSTQVVCGGSCSDGGSPISEYGLCWDTLPNPDISGNHIVLGSGETVFTYTLTGLTNNTLYYVRAYAINSIDTVYGEQQSFITDGCNDPLSLTDYDGNTYNSVKIGTQCWMKENLRTTHFADGTAIPLGTVSSSIISYRYNPNNDASNVNWGGYLYNWTAVMHGANSSDANPSGVQGVCPTGWHVPSSAEWTQLINYVGSQSNFVCGDNTGYIAKALASESSWGASSTTCNVGSNQNENDATSFRAKAVGYYNGYLINGTYSGTGSFAYFWSTSQSASDSSLAWVWYLYYSSAVVQNSTNYKSNGHSVRCLRDE